MRHGRTCAPPCCARRIAGALTSRQRVSADDRAAENLRAFHVRSMRRQFAASTTPPKSIHAMHSRAVAAAVHQQPQNPSAPQNMMRALFVLTLAAGVHGQPGATLSCLLSMSSLCPAHALPCSCPAPCPRRVLSRARVVCRRVQNHVAFVCPPVLFVPILLTRGTTPYREYVPHSPCRFSWLPVSCSSVSDERKRRSTISVSSVSRSSRFSRRAM